MRHISPAVISVVFLLAGGPYSGAQVPAPGPARIASPRPLADASVLLQRLYGKVVTYEEPVWVWPGELESMNGRDTGAKWGLHPRVQAFTMPAETGSELDLASVAAMTIVNYNQQIAGTRFQLLISAWGFHIVPIQTHDETGTLIAAHNILDTRVSIAKVERTASQHFNALLAAITGAAGVRVASGIQDPKGFNRLFRSEPASFSWGTEGMGARDALIDLLQRSATTFTWQLRCQASARSEDRFCALNMSMLEVAVKDPQGQPALRVLKFDRCGNCPPIAPVGPVPKN